MIKVDKKSCPTKLREKLEEYQEEELTKKPKKFKNRWGKAKNILYSLHIGKCCYCERKNRNKGEMDVEHYRPKGRVKEDENHSGYWWLAYDWDNLLLACRTCNQSHKKTHFPIAGKRAKRKNSDVGKEKPLLLNPAIDDGEKYFDYEWDDEIFAVKIKPKTNISKEELDRAKATEKILGLNRKELLEERGEVLLDLRRCAIAVKEDIEEDNLKELSLKKLKEVASSKGKFSGFARFFLKLEYPDLYEKHVESG